MLLVIASVSLVIYVCPMAYTAIYAPASKVIVLP